MKFSDFFDSELLYSPFPSIPDSSLPRTEEQRKEHVLAIAQTCYDNGDMLWQDDWFDLADNHLVPLFNYYIQTDADMPSAMFFFPMIVDISCNFGTYPLWRDHWHQQDDYYYFCHLIFHFVFTYAEEFGFGDETREKFSHMWNNREQELVEALINKPWM